MWEGCRGYIKETKKKGRPTLVASSDVRRTKGTKVSSPAITLQIPLTEQIWAVQLDLRRAKKIREAGNIAI